jgi:hypothetical protein
VIRDAVHFHFNNTRAKPDEQRLELIDVRFHNLQRASLVTVKQHVRTKGSLTTPKR